MPESMHVDVVAANRLVWEGEGVNVIVRTTEGDIGILPGHEPVLAALVPCVATIVTPDGKQEVLALDGGFVLVADNRVSLLAQYATRSAEVSLEEAQRNVAELEKIMDTGDATTDQVHRLHLAQAQVKAAQVTAGSVYGH
ncbi:MAG TPA: F0F1 ATP synthase subunit epsilon [Propionibacteriaceae bacterium]|nr:F0F1 ATP synthase subunit epsilon [Propionibacteriaceae bacterium]HEX2858550.1 F0F1 ATP synthase subunit epsilon [Propionibacteriaceae bacterium]